MQTRVVNVKSSTCDVYIGRASRGTRHSKWANPFKIGPDCTREQAIARYEKHLRLHPELMAALPELKGKRLGCWCAPLACHGDILVKLIEKAKRKAAENETQT